MFTGIIEEIGQISRITATQIDIRASLVLEDTNIGDSIAVNGVCLTVCRLGSQGFTADIMPETFRRSSFSIAKTGQPVNLERALTPTTRMGGHIVTGHIDCCGKLLAKRTEQSALWLTIQPPEDILRYIVEKGSVALQGTSLTVASVDGGAFSVSLIPATQEMTILSAMEPGAPVNIECDIIGKYIEKLMQKEPKSNISLEFLQQHGF